MSKGSAPTTLCFACGKAFKAVSGRVYCSIQCRAKGDGEFFKWPSYHSIRFAVFARDGFRCVYCGNTAREIRLEMDHCLPVIEGGLDTPENIVTACSKCNTAKGAKFLKKEVILKIWTEAMENTSIEIEGLFKEWNEIKPKIKRRVRIKDQNGTDTCSALGPHSIDLDLLDKQLQKKVK